MPTAIPPSLALSMPLSEHNTNKMAALDMLLQCAGIIWRWAQGGKTCSCNVLNPETVIVIHFTTFTLQSLTITLQKYKSSKNISGQNLNKKGGFLPLNKSHILAYVYVRNYQNIQTTLSDYLQNFNSVMLLKLCNSKCSFKHNSVKLFCCFFS